MRKKIVAANWKMNGNLSEVMSFANQLSEVESEAEIVFSPPSIYLSALSGKNYDECFGLSAQTISEFDDGAYTGEISVEMLVDLDCKYAIVGHSERRCLFSETNEMVYRKAKKAFSLGLIPIFCIGETDEENQKGLTESVLKAQLNLLIENTEVSLLEKVIIAYEPVWAIGSGRTPSIEEIDDIHKKIRSMFAEKSDTIPSSVRIIYGGSVKPDNAKTIFDCDNVDGGLVGGASLTMNSFKNIIKAC